MEAGRHKMFSSPEEMQKAIDSYFAGCNENNTPYTIEGLCEYLDCDRKTLLNYEKNESYSEFFHTVKKAKLKVQRNLVERALVGGCSAPVSIFLMKNNFGYEDKSEVQNNISFDIEF